jgi:hypothetical protein
VPYRFVNAREQVLEHLDDESGARYARETGSNTESFRKIDRQLKNQCSSTLDDYVRRGGDRFNELLEVSTSSDTGSIDLASYGLLHIRGVRVDTGSALYRIEEGDALAGGRPDLVERDLELTVVRAFVPPESPDEDDWLMGDAVGVARSWDAFDELVCARAADALGAKNDETRAAIQRQIARLEKAVFGHTRTPAALPWLSKRTPAGLFLSGRLRWLWHAKEQRLDLVYGVR